MAFTGVAVIKEVSDGLVRIAGLSLAQGASGTIGLHESVITPGVRLPERYKPRPYKGSAAVAMVDSIQVSYTFLLTAGVAVPIQVVKTGDEPVDWVATLTNTGVAGATGAIEIYVRFH